MPRRARIHLDGVPLHIVQRDHNRRACFFAEEDFRSYLKWLHEALHEGESSLHAYALMTNHVRLLVALAKAATIPKVMISLGRRYIISAYGAVRSCPAVWRPFRRCRA